MQHIEHAGAHQPRNFRRKSRAQANRRQHNLPQRSPAAGGKYRPDEDEQNDQQARHDEIRHGNADRRQRHQRKIEQPAAPHGRNNSGG